MRNNLRILVLHVAKVVGLFHLSRRLTRSGLRILCYHAFEFEDESSFRARMFLRPQTFAKRLEFLRDRNFPILPLEQALILLEQRKLPSCSTVITIDDGFFSVYQLALRFLKLFSVPATVYVASYYCDRGNPVFRLAVQYMFWKSRLSEIALDDLGVGLTGKVSIRDSVAEEKLIWTIIQHGETHCDEPQRRRLCELLGRQLGVDYDHIANTRIFGMMTSSEISDLIAAGVDIQLHTHRHRFPEEQSVALKELEDNRTVLEPLAGKPLRHFCYPSGIFSEKQFDWLRAAGIDSATTCQPGINSSSTEKLALVRFLDGEDISEIEFEAELYGLTELLRRIRAGLRQFIPGRSRRDARSPS
jgi:peptidoglycan/xylan/chitin deacetylase (PgdA/CDA1 family)